VDFEFRISNFGFIDAVEGLPGADTELPAFV